MQNLTYCLSDYFETKDTESENQSLNKVITELTLIGIFKFKNSNTLDSIQSSMENVFNDKITMIMSDKSKSEDEIISSIDTFNDKVLKLSEVINKIFPK